MMKSQKPNLEHLPKHVALILDGNGRWAQRNLVKRLEGHYEGAKRVADIVECARATGISFLTLYVFSEENWKRPQSEVKGLIKLLEKYLKKERQLMIDNAISLRTIGNVHKLPQKTQDIINEVKEATHKGQQMILTLALSYGGRDEILRAVNEIAQKVKEDKLKPEDITEDLFSSHLDTHFMPDPDIIIRTSGEKRISNFLPWQCTYSEFFFLDKFWPEFKEEDFFNILKEFENRDRRFGGLKPSSSS